MKCEVNAYNIMEIRQERTIRKRYELFKYIGASMYCSLRKRYIYSLEQRIYNRYY